MRDDIKSEVSLGAGINEADFDQVLRENSDIFITQRYLYEPTNRNLVNTQTDFVDFKTRMTEMDTINVFVDHSVCTYQGYERLLITKISDSIKVRSEYKDYDRQNADWELVFEKMLPENDTTWDFGNFLKQNADRLNSDVEEHAKLEIKNGGQQMRFVTEGLVDLNRFKADYDTTMRKLYEPTEKYIYGVPIPAETEIVDEK